MVGRTSHCSRRRGQVGFPGCVAHTAPAAAELWRSCLKHEADAASRVTGPPVGGDADAVPRRLEPSPNSVRSCHPCLLRWLCTGLDAQAKPAIGLRLGLIPEGVLDGSLLDLSLSGSRCHGFPPALLVGMICSYDRRSTLIARSTSASSSSIVHHDSLPKCRVRLLGQIAAIDRQGNAGRKGSCIGGQI